MNRTLIASILVLAAAVTQAEARSPIGGATMPREQVQSDALGPRSDRGLQRTADGTWRAVARDQRNAPVAVSLDNQGNVTPTK
jgi:hypothetical protein